VTIVYSLAKNYVTPNINVSTEINAHFIVLAANKLKKENLPQLFLPWRMSSQSCEGFFRCTRSVSSSGSSQTNFTSLEFEMDRCKKVDASKRTNSQPFEATNKEFSVFELPSLAEIEKEIMRAQKDTEYELGLLGRLTNKYFYILLIGLFQRIKKVSLSAAGGDLILIPPYPKGSMTKPKKIRGKKRVWMIWITRIWTRKRMKLKKMRTCLMGPQNLIFLN
jgi:hypothetical protein